MMRKKIGETSHTLELRGARRILFSTGLQKIGFDTNGVHMGATDAKLPAFCTEFRRLSNGTGPGAKIQ